MLPIFRRSFADADALTQNLTCLRCHRTPLRSSQLKWIYATRGISVPLSFDMGPQRALMLCSMLQCAVARIMVFSPPPQALVNHTVMPTWARLPPP